MNAFIHILQNITRTEQIIYPRLELRNVINHYTNKSVISVIYLYQNIWNDYYTYEINTDKDHRVYWVYHYINSIFYDIDEREKMVCVLHDPSCFNYSIINKYKKIKNIIDNIFIDNKTKNNFMDNISKTQRAYRGFSKLSQLYKYKKAETQITTNLMYDEIVPKHRDTIEIYQEGSRYLFTKYDLLRIINTSLINSPYYFAEPLTIRNPYNNIAFSKSILYTIYFKLIDNPLKFPVLFHNFVWLDFDLHLFRVENECLIREQSFREYIYNTTQGILNIEMRNMINTYYPGKIKISKEFPTIDLIRILRPYYYLHLVSQYHIYGLEKIKLATEYLNYKLNELYIFNPLFGRKTYIKNKTIIGQDKKFNMDAPIFTMNQAYNYHLHKTNYSDCESESDTDNNDDNSVS